MLEQEGFTNIFLQRNNPDSQRAAILLAVLLKGCENYFMNKKIDLLRGHIFTSLTGLALPIMVTALVQMAYSLTDMAWIGLVGSPAVAAVGAGGMYVWLSQGVVALAKMGGQVKVAHSLGRGDKEDAAVFASGALQMGFLFAFL